MSDPGLDLRSDSAEDVEPPEPFDVAEISEFFEVSHILYKSTGPTIKIEVHYVDAEDLPSEFSHLADEVGSDYPYVRVFRGEDDEYVGEGILGYDQDGAGLSLGRGPRIGLPTETGNLQQMLMLPPPIENFRVFPADFPL